MLDKRPRGTSICVSASVATLLILLLIGSALPQRSLWRAKLRSDNQITMQAPSLPQLRVVCVSDTHGLHNGGKLTLPEGDVLLFAGDAGLRSTRAIQDFDAWLGSLPFSHKIVTLGNMDGAMLEEAPLGTACASLQHGRVLVDEIADVGGYKVLGSPWTPKFYGAWQFESEEAAAAHWARVLPPDALVDILVTHGPPHGFADQTRGRHVGDRALLSAVQVERERDAGRRASSNHAGPAKAEQALSELSTLPDALCPLTDSGFLLLDALLLMDLYPVLMPSRLPSVCEQALHRPPLLWVCGHIHDSHGVYRVPHPALPKDHGILLINAAVAYLAEGVAKAGPRAVDLPAGMVYDPAVQKQARRLQEHEVWKPTLEMVL